MTLPLRKRTVHFYDIRMLSTTAADVNNPSTCGIAAMLASFGKLASSKTIPFLIRGTKDIQVWLSAWRYDRVTNCYELLINKANADLSDIALRDLKTSNLRKANKTRTEGIEVSAHVMIRPNVDDQSAAVLLTMGAGVSHGDVEVLIRRMVKAVFSEPSNSKLFFFDVPSGAKGADGQPLQYKVRYSFATYAHKGQTLDTALRGGSFESMELVAFEHTDFDVGGNLKIKERAIRIDATLPGAQTGSSVRNAIRYFQSNPDGALFNKLRIHYKTAAGGSTSAILDTNDLDAAFTLKEHINFDTDVESQHTVLNDTIVSKMKPLLTLLSP